MIANFSSWFVFNGGGSEISVKISRSSLWVSLSLIKSKSFVILFSEHSSVLLSLLTLRHFRVLFIKTAWHNFVSASWIDRSLLRQILNVFFLMLLRSCLRLLFKKSGCLGVGSFLNFPIVSSDLPWSGLKNTGGRGRSELVGCSTTTARSPAELGSPAGRDDQLISPLLLNSLRLSGSN